MSAFICHACDNLSDADDGCEETADGFHLICVDCAEAAEAEREEASSRLIDAAPALLQTLRELCDQLGDAEEHGDGAHDGGCSICIAHADARAAIAKATGADQ